jgi:hypothetical protein
MKINFTKEEDDIIIYNYGKIPYKEISKILNTDWMSVRQRAKKLGIITPVSQMAKRRFSGSKCININHCFFNQPNILNAYWGGYLAADGCLVKDGNSYVVRLKLGVKDVHVLEKLKQDLNYEGRVLFYKSKYIYKGENKETNICLLKFSSETIFEDLFYWYNLTPNKTFTLEFPNRIEDVDILLSFIIGYIDGDGCIKKNGYGINILGNENFLIKMKLFLEKLGILSSSVSFKSNSKIHELNLYGKNVKKLFQLSYRLFEEICPLKRKWDRIKI